MSLNQQVDEEVTILTEIMASHALEALSFCYRRKTKIMLGTQGAQRGHILYSLPSGHSQGRMAATQ